LVPKLKVGLGSLVFTNLKVFKRGDSFPEGFQHFVEFSRFGKIFFIPRGNFPLKGEFLITRGLLKKGGK